MAVRLLGEGKCTSAAGSVRSERGAHVRLKHRVHSVLVHGGIARVAGVRQAFCKTSLVRHPVSPVPLHRALELGCR